MLRRAGPVVWAGWAFGVGVKHTVPDGSRPENAMEFCHAPVNVRASHKNVEFV